MQIKRLQLGFRRLFRNSQRQIEDLGDQAEANMETLLFKRFGRLTAVRRFVSGWIGLVALLIAGLFGQNLMLGNYYQTLRTVPGGVYNEGILGSFTNANPLYATSNADASVSRLVFSGLLTYDQNGKLVGDLAQGYQTDTKGLNYTVHLKPNLHWHDGRPLTSADVVFTYRTIQNPDAQSPLQNSWRDIIVSAPNPQTVIFTLGSPLASFPYTLTNGIIPQHVLAAVPVADLRSTDFNTVHPVGSGPFKWQAIQAAGTDNNTAQEQIALRPFSGYQGGKPRLQEYIAHIYASHDQLLQAFRSGQLTAVQGINDLPSDLQHAAGIQQHNLPLKAATMVFFKTSSGLLTDKAIRTALVQSADVPRIVTRLGYPARLVREPFLSGQLGYNTAYAQAAFNLNAAKKSLDSDGWQLGAGGVRYKNKKPLTFSLSAANTPDNRMITDQLKLQWQALGAKLMVQLQEPTDFQSTLVYHNYDALLYGISIGTDPDVFVYWDSSQADIRSSNRLNFSEYKNPIADASLEAGRTRLDPTVRAYKYRAFLQAWQQDAPALALYQPRLLYATRGTVDGLRDSSITNPTDRFSNVQNWQIRQARVTN